LKNILLVEDDIDDQLLFRDAVSGINEILSCAIANNGREALECLQTPPPPDVIFLDLNMPIMNGIECLSALRNSDRYRNIPVIIFSTSSNYNDIERTKNMGATLFFHKPSSFKMLCERLRFLFGTPLDEQPSFYLS